MRMATHRERERQTDRHRHRHTSGINIHKKIDDRVHFHHSRELRGRVDQLDGEGLKPKPSTLNPQLRDLFDGEGLKELKPHLVQVW